MSGDLKATLNRDGVVVIPGFLSPQEAEELRLAGEQMEKEGINEQISSFSTVESEKNQNRDTYFLESNDKIRFFMETEGEGDKKRLNKVGHALHWLHPLFRFYTFSGRVKQACLVLGMEQPLVVQSMYIYKSAGVGGEVIPHQDASYLSTDPETAIGFWIALEDATVENGCLSFALGSHKSGVHRRFIRNPDKESSELTKYDSPAPLYPASNFVPLPVNKGDCVVIHGQVVHQSSKNKSDRGRPAYTFHVVEKSSIYSPNNWLQEGPAAPFLPLYATEQLA